MTDQWPDSHIRRLFAQLRTADSQAVPPFAALWQTASVNAARRTRLRALRRRATAVGVLVAAGVVLVVMLRPAPAPRVALSRWRSPTEFLLHGPGDARRWSVPALSASAVRLEPFQLEGVSP